MMSEHRERFAATIKARRIEKDLRQEDVAEALGLKQPAVSAWERGEAFPAVPTLFALANLLDLNVDELLNPGSEVQGLPAAADGPADAGQRRSEPAPVAAVAGTAEPPDLARHTAQETALSGGPLFGPGSKSHG